MDGVNCQRDYSCMRAVLREVFLHGAMAMTHQGQARCFKFQRNQASDMVPLHVRMCTCNIHDDAQVKV